LTEISPERYGMRHNAAVGNNTITMDAKMNAPFYFTASNNNPVVAKKEKYDNG